jgi:hypothetical protein
LFDYFGVSLKQIFWSFKESKIRRVIDSVSVTAFVALGDITKTGVLFDPFQFCSTILLFLKQVFWSFKESKIIRAIDSVSKAAFVALGDITKTRFVRPFWVLFDYFGVCFSVKEVLAIDVSLKPPSLNDRTNLRLIQGGAISETGMFCSLSPSGKQGKIETKVFDQVSHDI